MTNEIGARIKELRLSMGLSQQELAEKLGVKQNMVSKYENNVKRPSLEILVMLADILDTTADYLLEHKEI